MTRFDCGAGDMLDDVVGEARERVGVWPARLAFKVVLLRSSSRSFSPFYTSLLVPLDSL